MPPYDGTHERVADGPPVVVITGATGGLGAAIATACAERGFRLALVARTRPALERLAASLPVRPGSAVAPVCADVSDMAAAAAAMRRIHSDFGRVDVLVDNAGVEGPIGLTWEIPVEQWWEAVRVNTLSTFATVHAVLPLMVRQGGGRVISISSAAGRHRWPTLSSYSVAKAAGITFIENIASEARPHNVLAFSLHPGLVATGLTTSALSEIDSADPWRRRRARWIHAEIEAGRSVPLPRAVGAVLELATGPAAALSGRYLTVEDVHGAVRQG
ncbi:SDR family oxidoreductase [Streptomyces sp. UNOB3_S3]|uniref:SDR family oxidoreductase n=1 Tax=Streptomyces sp. UNOB3_S3 TaxID=2871682 RepID=UPI001E410693|nr:SDR family oxidoreductase [Streptomyces sp. UNOB3_S3]MCC3774801.1 SDR family oxidoreductase [Streptomyces sp. UNOB3_S3]